MKEIVVRVFVGRHGVVRRRRQILTIRVLAALYLCFQYALRHRAIDTAGTATVSRLGRLTPVGAVRRVDPRRFARWAVNKTNLAVVVIARTQVAKSASGIVNFAGVAIDHVAAIGPAVVRVEEDSLAFQCLAATWVGVTTTFTVLEVTSAAIATGTFTGSSGFITGGQVVGPRPDVIT